MLQPQPPADEDEATERLPGQRRIDVVALINKAKQNGRLVAARAAAPAAAAAEPVEDKPVRRNRQAAVSDKTPKKTAPRTRTAAALSCPYRAGSRIRHPKFGHGIVVSVAEGEEDPTLTVAFPRGGVKKILASFVEPA